MTGTSWCRDCYSIFQLTCPKRRRGWRQIWGPGSLEWNKAQLIVCVDHLDIFLSMTLEWQPRPFPFKICYDVIVKCHVHQRCDAEPTCIKFELSWSHLWILCSVWLANYITYFGRNSLISADIAVFRPKALRFGRNKNISAEYSVSAEFRFFRMASFGFRCFGKKSVSVGHYHLEFKLLIKRYKRNDGV